jgi:hypothetical protein
MSHPQGHRVVDGLEWASPSPRPGFGPSRARGAKALGLRYERQVARAVPGAEHGLWWQFRDRAGHGWCQTDLVVRGARRTLVLEAKLTWTWRGHTQIGQLYRPVLEAALGLPVVGVVVCRTLRPETSAVAAVRGTLREAVAAALEGRHAVWHWLGR